MFHNWTKSNKTKSFFSAHEGKQGHLKADPIVRKKLKDARTKQTRQDKFIYWPEKGTNQWQRGFLFYFSHLIGIQKQKRFQPWRKREGFRDDRGVVSERVRGSSDWSRECRRKRKNRTFCSHTRLWQCLGLLTYWESRESLNLPPIPTPFLCFLDRTLNRCSSNCRTHTNHSVTAATK